MNPPEIHIDARKLPERPAFAILTITGETANNPLMMTATGLRLLAEQCRAVADKLERADKMKAVMMPKPPDNIGQS